MGKRKKIVKDDEYWAEVERAVGKGTRSILWGTSTRSLRKALAKLRKIEEEKGQ
jgi:hypothetical protein